MATPRLQVAGVKDASGNLIVAPNTQETYVNGMPLDNGSGTLPLAQNQLQNAPFAVSGDGTSQVEILPQTPSADVIAFITSQMPQYVFNVGPTTTTSDVPYNPQYYNCATTQCLIDAGNRNPTNAQNIADDQRQKEMFYSAAIIAGAPFLATPVGQSIMFANGGASIMGGGVNAGAQYLTSGTINPTGVFIAAATGYFGGASQAALIAKYGSGWLGSGSSYVASTTINSAGTLVGNNINGEVNGSLAPTVVASSAGFIFGLGFGKISLVTGNVAGSIAAYFQKLNSDTAKATK
jgi:hypothetical protein